MINEHVWFCKGLLSGKVENINCIMTSQYDTD
jgi:hypothetical protein